MKRFHRWANDTVKHSGQLFHVSGGIYTREYREKRLPLPAPQPLDPEIQRLLRQSAEGTAPPVYGTQNWNALPGKLF